MEADAEEQGEEEDGAAEKVLDQSTRAHFKMTDWVILSVGF